MLPSEAEKILKESVALNPGLWEQHSFSVAKNARLIAEKVPGMDAEKAYTMGLLHDIGRRAGVTGIRHIFDGYDYMMGLGEEEIARICLTHSFPLKDVDSYMGKYDCTIEQKKFLERSLQQIEYSDYDILIQLCDGISLPNGACIMEKRLLDVALRYGVVESTVEKWRAFLHTKKYFDKLCGCNVYTLLPNILENSIEDLF